MKLLEPNVPNSKTYPFLKYSLSYMILHKGMFNPELAEVYTTDEMRYPSNTPDERDVI